MTEAQYTSRLYSQKTPDISPLRASYGMPFVKIFVKIDCVITAPHCIPWKRCQYHGCGCPGGGRSQDIRGHDIDYVKLVCHCLPIGLTSEYMCILPSTFPETTCIFTISGLWPHACLRKLSGFPGCCSMYFLVPYAKTCPDGYVREYQSPSDQWHSLTHSLSWSFFSQVSVKALDILDKIYSLFLSSSTHWRR